MPSAIVEAFNEKTQSFVAKCDDGTYACFRLVRPQELRVGDAIKWSDGEPCTVLRNVSSGAAAVEVDGFRYRLPRPLAMAYLEA